MKKLSNFIIKNRFIIMIIYLILLVVSGVAILINMGTNFIFKEISYITNSIESY